MAACYGVDFDADGEVHVARVHGDEIPTDPKTIEAIQAVCKAAYDMLKDTANA